jgi:hypothetical protein
MEERCHYRWGSGGGAAWDTEAALDAMAAGRTGGGGEASDQRRETKEERVEWAAKPGGLDDQVGQFQKC